MNQCNLSFKIIYKESTDIFLQNQVSNYKEKHKQLIWEGIPIVHRAEKNVKYTN